MSYYNIKEIWNENNLFNITHISLYTQIGTLAPKELDPGFYMKNFYL